MNDKINALLDELKQEIDNYVQTEVARLTGENASPEPSAETNAPPAPVKAEFGNDLPTPEMQMPTMNNSNTTVDVPPMPEPTAVPETSTPFAAATNGDANSDLPDPGEPVIAPGQETRDFNEQTVFADNQVTDQQGESLNKNQVSEFAAPQTTPPEAAVDVTAFDAAQDAPAPASTVPEFVMPAEVNSSTDATSGPLPDLNSSPAATDLPPASPEEDLPASASEPELPQAEPTTQPPEEDKGFGAARGLLGKVLNKKWGSKT